MKDEIISLLSIALILVFKGTSLDDIMYLPALYFTLRLIRIVRSGKITKA
ncbi:hypothetical protein L3N51_00324 [Metallosphaera sp. J1]|nr:hypothetical protein [Metallosphaera javensis (ex Hofmann et al. 2022)]MCG3108046.1 hypothetical protein [Metallosphaera javensis (ex Hofmann et al. 2022)]BCS91795.1 MAG: hypothetical protein MjAS7_0403 [Metallosphaera javensis (ex Sakai et al. 2022)]